MARLIRGAAAACALACAAAAAAQHASLTPALRGKTAEASRLLGIRTDPAKMVYLKSMDPAGGPLYRVFTPGGSQVSFVFEGPSLELAYYSDERVLQRPAKGAFAFEKAVQKAGSLAKALGLGFLKTDSARLRAARERSFPKGSWSVSLYDWKDGICAYDWGRCVTAVFDRRDGCLSALFVRRSVQYSSRPVKVRPEAALQTAEKLARDEGWKTSLGKPSLMWAFVSPGGSLLVKAWMVEGQAPHSVVPIRCIVDASTGRPLFYSSPRTPGRTRFDQASRGSAGRGGR